MNRHPARPRRGARLLGPLLAIVILLSAASCAPARVDMTKQAEYHYELASNFFYDKNIQSAIDELYKALKINPRLAKAQHLLGFIYFGRRDTRRALKHLRLAVAIDPKLDEAVANLGNLYLAMGEWEAAIPYFKRLLNRPTYGQPYLAHNNLAWALFKLHRYREARKHFKMAIFLNPKFCLGYNNLGRLNAKLGETAKALEHFNKAVSFCPHYAEPEYFLGRIYTALGAVKRGRAHFKRCHDIAPETPYGHRCEGRL